MVNATQMLEVCDKKFLIASEVYRFEQEVFRKLIDSETGEEFDLVIVDDSYYYGYGYPNYKIGSGLFTNDVREKYKSFKISTEFQTKSMDDCCFDSLHWKRVSYRPVELEGLNHCLNLNFINEDSEIQKALIFFNALASGQYLRPKLLIDTEDIYFKKIRLSEYLILEKDNLKDIKVLSMITYVSIMERLDTFELESGMHKEIYEHHLNRFKNSRITKTQYLELKEKVERRLKNAMLMEVLDRMFKIIYEFEVETFYEVDEFGQPIVKNMYYEAENEQFIIKTNKVNKNVDMSTFQDELSLKIIEELVKGFN